MIKTDALMKMTPEELLEDGLRPATLTEGSELFLHGYDEDVFPDTICCPYCGRTLTGAFDSTGAFRKECECESYQKEISVRKRYAKTLRSLGKALDALNSLAKEYSLGLVKGNTLMFLDSKRVHLKEELEQIECFKPTGTN